MISEYSLERVYQLLVWSFKAIVSKQICMYIESTSYRIKSNRPFWLDIILLWTLKGTHYLLGLIVSKGNLLQAICLLKIQNQLSRFQNDHHVFSPSASHGMTSRNLYSLAGGKAALVELRGDWKFQREAFLLKCHWTAKDTCHLCTARSPNDPIRRNRRVIKHVFSWWKTFQYF